MNKELKENLFQELNFALDQNLFQELSLELDIIPFLV